MPARSPQPAAEVAAVAARGQLRNLRMIIRHRRRDTVTLLALSTAAAALLAAGSGPWLLLLAVLVPLALAALLVLAGVIAALLARAGLGRRTVYVARTTTGRAIAITHAPRRHPKVWVVSDVLTARTTRTPPAADRTARPGYQVMTQVVAAADAARRELRLTASHRDVARKLYAPLGFTTDTDRTRPPMRRPPRPNAPPDTTGPLPSCEQPTPPAEDNP